MYAERRARLARSLHLDVNEDTEAEGERELRGSRSVFALQLRLHIRCWVEFNKCEVYADAAPTITFCFYGDTWTNIMLLMTPVRRLLISQNVSMSFLVRSLKQVKRKPQLFVKHLRASDDGKRILLLLKFSNFSHNKTRMASLHSSALISPETVINETQKNVFYLAQLQGEHTGLTQTSLLV